MHTYVQGSLSAILNSALWKVFMVSMGNRSRKQLLVTEQRAAVIHNKVLVLSSSFLSPKQENILSGASFDIESSRGSTRILSHVL